MTTSPGHFLEYINVTRTSLLLAWGHVPSPAFSNYQEIDRLEEDNPSWEVLVTTMASSSVNSLKTRRKIKVNVKIICSSWKTMSMAECKDNKEFWKVIKIVVRVTKSFGRQWERLWIVLEENNKDENKDSRWHRNIITKKKGKTRNNHGRQQTTTTTKRQ